MWPLFHGAVQFVFNRGGCDAGMYRYRLFYSMFLFTAAF